MLRFRRNVYLDNNATTRPSKEVVRQVTRVLKSHYGNPSSLYRTARDSAAVLEEARKTLAETINAAPEEIIFTGCASESNNAILKAVSAHFFPAKKRIVTTPIEHPSVLAALQHLERQGINVAFCPVDPQGLVRMEELERLIDGETFLVCCMYANNETGTVQDIGRIAEITKRKGVLLMSDCVQALGKIPVDVRQLGVNYATFSAHKIHGPKGIGAMYVKEGSPMSPLIHGGHQEQGLRAGTESTHNIAGFAAACAAVPGMLARAPTVRELKDRLVEGLREIKPDLRLNSPANDGLPNTASLTFPGIDNALFIAYLDYYGIAASAGSACNTQENAASHVLTSIGLSAEQARQTLRISLSDETAERDVAYFLQTARDFIQGEPMPVTIVAPGQLDENLLTNRNTFILDVRFGYDRKLLKSLPGAREASFVFIKKYLKQIPRDKNIIVICQGGYNSPITALYLKLKHYRNVGFLLGGMLAWKLCHGALYDKLAGKDVVRLNV